MWGFKQGGLLYPTLLNILFVSVVQKWLAGVCKLDILHHGVGLTMVEKDTTLNTDDEIIFCTYIRLLKEGLGRERRENGLEWE